MGKEYLTEAAVFECPLGMRYIAQEPVNTKAEYKGKKLLTSAAILLPNQKPISCKFIPPLPGVPPICPCIVSPLIDTIKHKATMNLLTMDAKAVCAAKQIVKATKSGSESRVMYEDAHSAHVAAIAWPKSENQSKNKTADGNKTQSGSDVKNSPDAKSQEVATNKDEKKIQQTNGDVATKTVAAAEAEETLTFREGMLCSHSKNNPKCRECAYRLDNEPATVNNSSVILRKNYNANKPHSDKYDCYFDETVEPLGNSKENKWSYAAHHLISGNQVFKQNAELVRLARFCGYDINGYENCIMLVGYPKDYPDGERMKSVKAYDVMSEGRVQWHVGGHSYKFTEEEKAEICKQIGIRNKIKLTPGDIKTYAELVQGEVERLRDRLAAKKNRQMICYVDQNAKRQLCEKLNRISQKIKVKLAAFSDVGKPHHSFPFFVSKEAYRYTYALPRTGKVITVLKEDSKLTLSMFRLEHFTEAIAEQDKSLLIKPKDSITLDLNDDMWQSECILFCDNVSFFVYLEDTPRDVLPFAVNKEYQFPKEQQATGTDGHQFLTQHDTEILVWLRDNPQYGYISPALMVKNRSKEYLFGEAGDNDEIL
ncbi:MAG: AHH domain-containing protein [Selenomonadaceae bacterium]|nr:AHH domain-containing protein [Selenomonadaceae bacterium]